MPLHLKEIQSITKTVIVPVLGEKLTITYRPYALTMDVEEKLSSATSITEMIPPLMSILVETDILLDNGKPMPPDEKHLRQLPFKIFMDIWTAIREDQSPQKSGATGSLG